MARPAKAPVLDSGLPNRAPGLPNTATAATRPTASGGSGAAEPMLPMRSPTGGTPASIETAAAPWEKPPSTNRVCGQRTVMSAMRAAASSAPDAAARKFRLAG